MKFHTLLLSRAPLSFRGGIPKYCASIYKNSNYPITSVSPEIDNSQNTLGIKILSESENNQEITFYSNKILHTAAISWSYFAWLRTNLSKFQTIHYQSPDPITAIIILFFIRPSQRLIVTWHAEIFNNFRYIYLLLIDLLIFNRSDHIVVFTKSHIYSSLILKYFKKKIKVIPMGIERQVNISRAILSKERSVERITESKRLTICAIGRLVAYKGYQYLLASIADNPFIQKCHIIGSGPLQEELDRLIISYGLRDKVQIINNADEELKNYLLLGSDLLVLPSISNNEAFGIVQIEAMMCAKPIIVSNLGNGVNELSTHLYNSIHVEPSSTRALANAYELLACNPILYDKLARNSLQTSYQYEAKRCVSVLDKLTND